MNSTVHTAYLLDRHRAAQLERENEIIRRQAERPAVDRHRHRPEVIERWFAVVTDWFRHIGRPSQPHPAH